MHPNEYNQEFYYYPFTVKLEKSIESCNTINDVSNKICIPNKTEDLNLNVFNMITGINESKTLTKHISCECKCKFDGRKCNSNQWWNNNKCQCECKKHICEKDYIWNHAKCSCKNRKYLASIIDNSVITYEIIEEETKTILMKKIQSVKQKILYLTGLFIHYNCITAVSIYCYLIKYKEKQKHLSFYVPNNELKDVLYC